MDRKITLEDIQQWPAVVGIPSASEACGFSKSLGYALAQRGEFPCRVIRVGNRYLVPTAGIIALLEGDGGQAA